eukprot:667396-Rhodomonas_salina.1
MLGWTRKVTSKGGGYAVLDGRGEAHGRGGGGDEAHVLKVFLVLAVRTLIACLAVSVTGMEARVHQTWVWEPGGPEAWH